MKRKPTLTDVARLAGVSTATVSNVINDSKRVGAEVRRRTNDAIASLNYIPNSLAKSLRVKESRLIGLMISDISNPYFPPVVRGIECRLAKNGFGVLLCDTDSDPEKEKEYLRLLLERRVDGLLVSLAGADHSHFAGVDIPIVYFNRVPESEPVNIVETENFEGGCLATEHFLNHGYRSIGIIAGPQYLNVGADRLRGYRVALERNGLAYDPSLVKVSPFSAEASFQAMREFMEQGPRPDAVFTCNNVLTLGAFRYLHEAGYRIPGDIALIGYDDPEWTTLVEPPLTVIRQQGFEMGMAAGELMLDCLGGHEKKAPRRIALKLELVTRKSCGCGIG